MTTVAQTAGFTGGFVDTGAVAGTTSTFTTTAAAAGLINGKFVTALGISTNLATPTTDATTGKAFVGLTPNQTCAIVFGQNAAGSLRMCQGPAISTEVGVTTTVGAFINAPQFPGLAEDFMPIAYTIVRTAPSAATFTPGTSSWTASGVSATTFKRIGQLPDRPQIA